MKAYLVKALAGKGKWQVAVPARDGIKVMCRPTTRNSAKAVRDALNGRLVAR